MKIIKETSDLMVIEESTFIFALFVGGIFVVVGSLVVFYPEIFDNKPPLIAGIVGILMGLIAILFSEIDTLSLDKTSNKLLIVSKSIIRKKINEYSLNQIKAIELRQLYRESEDRNKTGRGYSYRLVFILENAKEVPLPLRSLKVKVMGQQIQIGPERIIGTRIAAFLNIPFEERRPPTVSEALSAIQKTVQKEIEKAKGRENRDKSNF